MIYVYKWINNPGQYSRLRSGHIKQSCAHEIIHFNHMHGIKETTKVV